MASREPGFKCAGVITDETVNELVARGFKRSAIEEIERYREYLVAGKPGNDFKVWVAAQEEREHE